MTLVSPLSDSASPEMAVMAIGVSWRFYSRNWAVTITSVSSSVLAASPARTWLLPSVPRASATAIDTEVDLMYPPFAFTKNNTADRRHLVVIVGDCQTCPLHLLH